MTGHNYPLKGGNILLYYFTGTGNSYRIAEIISRKLRDYGCDVKSVSIEDKFIAEEWEEHDCHGFIFPVHAFGLPRVMINFIKSLPDTKGKQAFILCTMGGDRRGHQVATGMIMDRARKFLTNKGYEFRGGKAVVTPENFIFIAEPPPPDEVDKLMESAQKEAERFVTDLVQGKVRTKRGNIFQWLFLGPVRLLYLFGLNSGLVAKFFKVNKRCDSCGICQRVCPVGNIGMVQGRPIWSNRCELCFRCINVCPTRAIDFTSVTRGRRRYQEPHLKIEQLCRGKNR